MTTPSDPSGDPGEVPFLPSSTPRATGSMGPDQSAAAPTVPPAGDAPPAPFVPEPPRPTPDPQPEPAFDAKAMVESQKRVNTNPAYGALPQQSDQSREASKKLRAQAQRKKTRNKLVVRFLMLIVLAGLGVGGWFAWQAYQDDQNAETEVVRDDRDAEEILEDLGSQGEMINAQDALNEAVVPRVGGGGLAGAIDDAREVVGDINAGGGEGGGEPTPFTYDVVVPPIVRSDGERFPDASGREIYVIGADEFAAGDPDGFGLFVRLMAIQPQLIPEAEAFQGLPAIGPDQIVIAVTRDGDRLTRATVVGESVNLRVDVTP